MPRFDLRLHLPHDLCQIQVMNTAPDAQVPFTSADITVHTLTTWALGSVMVGAYWGAEASSPGGGFDYLGWFLAFSTVAVFILCCLGSPLAWLTARALRTVTSTWVHIGAFGALGAVASVPVSWVMLPWTSLEGEPVLSLRMLGVAVLCGICAAAARAVAFLSRARRERRPPRPVDPEDALLDAMGTAS